MIDFIACLVCGIKYDHKTSEYCLDDVNGNILHGIVAPDWKHMWKEANDKTVWEGTQRETNKRQG